LIAQIDHCFNLKGKGTILTGTILSGELKLNDRIELPEFGEERQVKGIQIYRRETKKVSRGDRMAVLVPTLNAKAIERCVMTSPSALTSRNIFFSNIQKVRHYKGNIKSRSKFHISINHINVMGELVLISNLKSDDPTALNSKMINEMKNKRTEEIDFEKLNFDSKGEFEYVEEITENNIVKFTKSEMSLSDLEEQGRCLILVVKLSKAVFIRKNSFFIGSRMDFHEESKNCRIAFYGHTIETLKQDPEVNLNSLISNP
jgi:selenocysteine-specific elongation factor